MKIEIYSGNNLEGSCEDILSEELWQLFWKAIDEKEDITIYFGDVAEVSFEYCESDELWDTSINNVQNDDWCDGGYLYSSYHETDLHIPIRETEGYVRNGWS